MIDRRDAHVIKGGKRAGYRMTAANTHARVRTLIAVVALATTAGTLALAAGSAAAAAAVSTPRPAHTVSQIDKPAATPPSDTIAGATQLTLGDEQSGGGGPVDFWRVKLTGGDQVQIATQTPTMTPGGAYTSYSFELYPPGTTDASFPQTPPADSTATGGGSAKAILTLQAPYTGTFILAVCENATGDCRSTDNGSGINPMQPYTFTPTITGNPCGTSPAGEVRAGNNIAAALQFDIPNCQAGGGGGPVDFWRVKLTGGDQVQIATQTPTMTPGGNYASYSFELYPPGTTDTSFPQTPPVFTTATPGGGSAKAIITLKAPYTGTFILAVCEDATGDCRSTDNGSGINPMQPYTFTPTITGGPATMTSLKLSASRVQYGDEKALKLTVTVKARYSSAHPAGTVTIKAGKKRICTVKLARGKGTCSPASRKLLAVGTYHLVASYDGSKTFSASASKAATLKIARAKRK